MKDNSISFLDVSLQKNNNTLIYNWYKKSSTSDRILHFSSNHPTNLLINIVFNLVDRSILLSHEKFHKHNIQIIKNILKLNGYPENFIKKHIYRRLHILNNRTKNSYREVINIGELFQLPDNNEYYEHNYRIANNIHRPLFSVNIPFINSKFYNSFKALYKKYRISIHPTIKRNMSNIIKLGKDHLDSLHNTHAVYQIKCLTCPDLTYVGETKRQLMDRIKEHKKCTKIESVVSNHMVSTGHQFDWENVRILDREKDFKKRLISEMVHIKIAKNTINRKEDIDNLSHVYNSILSKIK